MPQSRKDQQRPSSGYGTGTLAIGLRIVYTGEKAKCFPRATCHPSLLDSSQRRALFDDLAHISRRIGSANPRKDDTQLSVFMDGCVEVVWPELRRNTDRYESILSEMCKLDDLSGEHLSQRSISCLIIYSLPSTTSSLSKCRLWDDPCLLVVDPNTVDLSLESRCRMALIREPLLDQALARQQSYNGSTRDNARERRPSLREGNDWSISPHHIHARCARSLGPGRLPGVLPRSLSPIERGRMRSRSPSRSCSPPRKRFRPVVDDIERSKLLETVDKLQRERDIAFEREDALRRELESITDESKSFAVLEQQVNAWKSKVERSERRAINQEQRLSAILDAHSGGACSLDASALASGASPVAMLEAILQDYHGRDESAVKNAERAKAHYNTRIGAMDTRGSYAEGGSLSNALSVVAKIAATMGL